MVDLENAGPWWSASVIGVIGLCVSTSLAQPVAFSPRWQVSFPANAGADASESTAVPLEDGRLMVTVLPVGIAAGNPKLQQGNRAVAVKLVGQDPVSRLVFYRIEDPNGGVSRPWSDSTGVNSVASLQAMGAAGAVSCKTTGWVKQVGGKVLPFALLRVEFSEAVPAPGTPLIDGEGKVTGIVFQSSGKGKTGYAIPAEAVHRVKKDICDSGHLNRGWLGLALRAESQTPQISRVLPESPAAAAGIRPNDVLLGVGAIAIVDYADAANAFFYLIPGKPVKVKLLRDAKQIEYSLTPVLPK